MELKTYTISPIIPDKLHREVMLSNSVTGFKGLNIIGDDVTVIGDEISDESILDSVFDNHVGIDAISDRSSLYRQKRVIDGQQAFYSLMSELAVTREQNNLPREINKFIERKLKNVRDEIVLGQWISAREYLDEVVVESYLTQELYDRVKSTLDAYIAENY